MADVISVTGMGIICAVGNDTQSVLDSLRQKKSGIGKMEYLRSRHGDIPVGEVKLSTDEMKDMLGIDRNRTVSRTSAMGAIAVREALAQAGIGNASGKRVALVSGTTVGVMDVTEEYYERMKTEPDLEYLPHSNECGKSTEEIAEYAGLKEARCCTICTACSSALNAIMLGSDMLLRGEADIAVVGGSESLSRFHLNGFNSLMILDRERCRPFDDRRAGLNLGEGAAFLVLEKNASNALATVEGYANRCDAFHQTATSPSGEGAFLAMSEALNSAGLSASDIDYINAHGTATPDNDASESAAFKRVFADALPPVSSTKSYTGHTTSASGSIEAVICILAMNHGFIPASLGWSNPMPEGIIPSLGAEGVELRNVMCNSFGFGGNDSSLILGRAASGKVMSLPCRCAKATVTSRETVGADEELPALKEYLSPMETRRMGKLMKACLLSAFLAMKKAGISRPDAIVTATSRGMFEMSTIFLEEIVSNGEELLKPTVFMQSTHNTIGSTIAIRTGCHGYNITYSQGEDSLKWAERDAERLICSGQAGAVLLCAFDETVKDGVTDRFKAECRIYKAEI